MFRCYLKVFAKMVTEIIILYRKSPSEGPVGHLLLQQETMWKKQVHCISQKIFLTGVDSDIKGLLDYAMHYIIKYNIFLKNKSRN